ncbi:serine/threonine protein kinase [Nonomuraea soli]|uniref:Protein kinase domain-containing protein n=1 Tax=Nonomuraea soli TaxID=1032476 RepID=A0A7W0HQE1_9ACTN|nr:serine/threonine-protein kinase [Nonomuraea soli]MBA2891551.1 hypothetical protein [Nonomuraea soli]
MQPLRSGDPQALGNYQLTGFLGEGGQGTVFAGYAPGGARVAVKILHARFASDTTAVQRFHREVELAQRVAQFCTARVLDHGVAGGVPYIVSEFVEGISLQEAVRRRGPLRGDDLVRLAVATLTALVSIHRAGIVHRDFKPSNVLLAADGPRVIDFGIARALDAPSVTASSVVGSPGYMSPEQIMGASVGAASDLFSWAGTMVFAATGKPAFGNDTIPAVMHRVLNVEPDLSEVPEPVRGVLATCLVKEAARRPDAQETWSALMGGSAPATGPISASPTAGVSAGHAGPVTGAGHAGPGTAGHAGPGTGAFPASAAAAVPPASFGTPTSVPPAVGAVRAGPAEGSLPAGPAEGAPPVGSDAGATAAPGSAVQPDRTARGAGNRRGRLHVVALTAGATAVVAAGAWVLWPQPPVTPPAQATTTTTTAAPAPVHTVTVIASPTPVAQKAKEQPKATPSGSPTATASPGATVSPSAAPSPSVSPTPTATPSTGTVAGGWKRRSHLKPGPWKITGPSGARLNGYVDDTDMWRGLLWKRRPMSTDFSVSVRVRLLDLGRKQKNPKFGLLLSHTGSLNDVALYLEPQTGGGVATAIFWTNGQMAWYRLPQTTMFDMWAPHTLKVVRTGKLYSFFVDGEKQFEHEGTVDPKGVGWVGVAGSDVRADYRNFTLKIG